GTAGRVLRRAGDQARSKDHSTDAHLLEKITAIPILFHRGPFLMVRKPAFGPSRLAASRRNVGTPRFVASKGEEPFHDPARCLLRPGRTPRRTSAHGVFGWSRARVLLRDSADADARGSGAFRGFVRSLGARTSGCALSRRSAADGSNRGCRGSRPGDLRPGARSAI